MCHQGDHLLIQDTDEGSSQNEGFHSPLGSSLECKENTEDHGGLYLCVRGLCRSRQFMYELTYLKKLPIFRNFRRGTRTTNRQMSITWSRRVLETTRKRSSPYRTYIGRDPFECTGHSDLRPVKEGLLSERKDSKESWAHWTSPFSLRYEKRKTLTTVEVCPWEPYEKEQNLWDLYYLTLVNLFQKLLTQTYL